MPPAAADAPLMAGVLVAGTRSGCGKTTLTLSLLAALRRRGLLVQPCKAGPDFIDPTHHAAITGRPSYNCDTWMGGEDGVRRVLARLRRQSPPADFLLAEGVMGLFDGAQGMGGPGSSAHLARALHLPILLAVDVRGMGQSAAALAAGYVRQQPELRFAGLVCTHVGGQAHADMLREAFAHTFGDAGPPLLGLLPRQGLPELPSRHLGLIMAHEQHWTPAQAESLAAWCETHMDVAGLLRQCAPPPPATACPQSPENSTEHCPAQSPACFPEHFPEDCPTHCPAHPTVHFPEDSPACFGDAPSPTASPPPAPRVGIARDEAFCFLYPDMPDVMRELGAEIVFFSPLRDAAPPPGCTLLYFPGGYPELYAARLAANAGMRAAAAAFAASGGRIYGECGGYMYLMRSIEYEGRVWPMSGCLPLRCRVGARRAALGYREVSPLAPSCFNRPSDGTSAARAALAFDNDAAVPGGTPTPGSALTSDDALAPGPARPAPSGRGHEFHYAALTAPATLPPLWRVRDRQGRPLPHEGVAQGSVAASWVHLYPEGARPLLHILIHGAGHAHRPLASFL